MTVRVRTASGRTMSTSHGAYWFEEQTWYGAAKMDGRAGYELVVGSSMGAHRLEFRVITYRDGALTTAKAPGGAWRWVVDASFSYNEGWFRTTSAAGTVIMTSKTAYRATESTHSSSVNRYIWRSGSWVRTSSSQSRVSDKTAWSYGGWHVPYLPVYV